MFHLYEQQFNGLNQHNLKLSRLIVIDTDALNEAQGPEHQNEVKCK